MKIREIITPIVTVLAVTCFGLTWNASRQDNSRKQLSIVVTADSQKVSTTNLYDYEPIAISGRVLKVSNNGYGRTIELGTDSTTVFCEFPAIHNNIVDHVKTGEAVAVRGVCASLLPDVILIHCVFE